MHRFEADVVFPGNVIGTIKTYKRNSATSKNDCINVNNVGNQDEMERFAVALKKAKEENAERRHRLMNRLNDAADILDAYEMILGDEGYIKDISDRIKKDCFKAEEAVKAVTEIKAMVLDNSGDEYLTERAEDIRYIGNLIIEKLMFENMAERSAEELSNHRANESVILAAENLNPVEIIDMATDDNLPSAVILCNASSVTHSVILLKSIGVITLVGADENILSFDGQTALIQCDNHGAITINPSPELIGQIALQHKGEDTKDNDTLSGNSVLKAAGKMKVLMNAATIWEIEKAVESDIPGIGLYRSEFFFLGRDEAPSEKEQYEHYCKILELMEGKPITIRTFDFGGDKNASYIKTNDLKREYNCETNKDNTNPYSNRGIKLALANREMFRTQLKALIRASSHGNLKIMFPMISDISEWFEITETVNDVCTELSFDKQSLNMGIMVETPQILEQLEEMSDLVDFFCVGTNDLFCLLNGIDRYIGKKEYNLFEKKDEFLQIMKRITDCAHKSNIEVCVCGDVASEPNAVRLLDEIGVDEISVPYSVYNN